MTKSRFLQPAFFILHKFKKIADVCGVKIDDIINPLPPLTPADEMLDFVSTTYVNDKTDAENGDAEAIIRNRFA